MNVRFSGLMNALELASGDVSVLEIHNSVLFARACQSLSSQKGEYAIEPYSVWDDAGNELSSSQTLLYVGDPFKLPWDDKALVGELRSLLENMVFEDEPARQRIESLATQLSSAITQMGFQVEGDYHFALEWELQRYLKAFNFSVEHDPDVSLLDNVIKFIDFVADVMADKVIVFVNLKIFLSENELTRLYERIFFRNVKLLLLESIKDEIVRHHEVKLVVDQDFLERC